MRENKHLWNILFISIFLLTGPAQALTQQELLIQSLRKELALSYEIISASEQIMANADNTSDFTKYLAAKNEEIKALKKEIHELRRQQPEIMRPQGEPTIQEEAHKQEINELQKKFSNALEKLNDVESELNSLRVDYDNNINKLSIYAQDNERLLLERNQLQDDSRSIKEELTATFEEERQSLSEQIDYLSAYNKELLLTKESILERIKTDQRPQTGEINILSLELEEVRQKLREKDGLVETLVDEKRQLIDQIEQLTQSKQAAPPPAKASPPEALENNKKYEQQLDFLNTELIRLENAINQKELHYNSLLRENDTLNDQFNQLSVGIKESHRENIQLSQELEELKISTPLNLAAQVKPLKAEIVRLEKELGKRNLLSNKRLAEVRQPLDDKINDLQNQLENTKELVKVLKGEKKEFLEFKDQKAKENRVLAKEKEKLVKRMADLEGDLEKTQKRMDEKILKQRDHTQREALKYEEEINSLKENLEFSKKENEHLKNELQKISRDYKKLRRDLEFYQAQAESDQKHSEASHFIEGQKGVVSKQASEALTQAPDPAP